MMTCAYAFIQSDERNIAIAHISKLFLNFHFYNIFFNFATCENFLQLHVHFMTWMKGLLGKNIYIIFARKLGLELEL